MVRRIQGLCYKSGPKVRSGIRDSYWNQKPGSGSMIAAGSEESWDGNRGRRSDAGVRCWPAMSVALCSCSVCPAHCEPGPARAPALTLYPNHWAAAQAGREGGGRGGAAAPGGQGRSRGG